jgi:hypothetical protein
MRKTAAQNLRGGFFVLLEVTSVQRGAFSDEAGGILDTGLGHGGVRRPMRPQPLFGNDPRR